MQGILVDDSELKRTFSQARPYEEWLDRQLMTLDGVVQSVPEEERQAAPIIGTLPVCAFSFTTCKKKLFTVLFEMAFVKD